MTLQQQYDRFRQDAEVGLIARVVASWAGIIFALGFLVGTLVAVWWWA